MIIKKFLLFVFITLPIIFILSIGVNADTGPKPSVTINIENNIEGTYLTLLSLKSSTGPYYNKKDLDDYNEDDYSEIDIKFANYVDKDNFYYLFTYSDISKGNYRWGYYPPSTFKILVYDSINDKFITDDVIYTKQDFNDYYTLTFEGDSFTSTYNFSTEKEVSIAPYVWDFFVRLAICLIIEIVVALIFKFFKWQLLIVIITNILTQVILNLVLFFYTRSYGINNFAYWLYALLEVGIVGIEFFIYYLFLNKFAHKYSGEKKSVVRILNYSIIANLSSLLIGYGILLLFDLFYI